MAFPAKTRNLLISRSLMYEYVYVQTLVGLQMSAFSFSTPFSKTLDILMMVVTRPLMFVISFQGAIYQSKPLFSKLKFLLLNTFFICSSLCVKDFASGDICWC